MKAVICTAYGAPEVLHIEERPTPIPKDDEVLIRIKATAVNSGDVRMRGLDMNFFFRVIMRVVVGFSKPRNPILGTVLSGVVEGVGSSVTRFKKGDEIIASTVFAFGAYAEYAVVKETGRITFKPKNATFEEAVSIIFGGMSALYFLEKANLMQGEKKRVLIYGATGAVGVAALQIAKYHNVHVTAVCGTEGVSLCERLGSDVTLVYTETPLSSLQEKFDIVFDAVGKASSRDCKNLLTKEGEYVTVGGLDTATETQEQIETLRDMYEQGKLVAVIDKTFSFDDIVESHRYVDTGKKKGSVVVTVA